MSKMQFDQKMYEKQIQEVRMQIQATKHKIEQKKSQIADYYDNVYQDYGVRCHRGDGSTPTSPKQVAQVESEVRDLTKEMKSFEDQILIIKSQRRMALEGLA